MMKQRRTPTSWLTGPTHLPKLILVRLAIALCSLLVNSWAIASFSPEQKVSRSMEQSHTLSMKELHLRFVTPNAPKATPRVEQRPLTQKQAQAKKTEPIKSQPAIHSNRTELPLAKPAVAVDLMTMDMPTVIAKTDDPAQQPAASPTSVANPNESDTMKQIDAESSANEPSTPRLTAPSFLSPPKPPRYPTRARKRGQQGTVWLEVWLDKKGAQTKLFVSKSSGVIALDSAALSAVSHWNFRAHRLEGLTVASRVTIPLEFELN